MDPARAPGAKYLLTTSQSSESPDQQAQQRARVALQAKLPVMSCPRPTASGQIMLPAGSTFGSHKCLVHGHSHEGSLSATKSARHKMVSTPMSTASRSGIAHDTLICQALRRRPHGSDRHATAHAARIATGNRISHNFMVSEYHSWLDDIE